MTKTTTRMLCALACWTLFGCSQPPTQPIPDAPDVPRLTGRVQQRISAGPYTYLLVANRWVVTLGEVAPGIQDVDVVSIGTKRDFYSARLQRSFESLVFGIVKEKNSGRKR